MAHVDQIWAGWRQSYIQSASEQSELRRNGDDASCLMCELKDQGKDHYVIAKNQWCFAVMNLYPYASGHVMIVPNEHQQYLDDLDEQTRSALMEMSNTATMILRKAYNPQGINMGANMGEAAGAGIPGHLHIHVLPRWIADANFMTSIANTRTLPEALQDSYEKIHSLWPEDERI